MQNYFKEEATFLYIIDHGRSYFHKKGGFLRRRLLNERRPEIKFMEGKFDNFEFLNEISIGVD